MKLQFAIGVALTLLAAPADLAGQGTNRLALPIDLPTALRLGGAQNLDVQIAREKLAEAKANHQTAVSGFFPWLSPGITYRRHDDRIQDVEGNLVDVHKYSYAPGASLAVQLELGEAIYNSLAARQLAQAADQELKAQRQDSTLAAAHGYFDLALAQGAVLVARDSVRISVDYETQLVHAVDAGLAFKGDLLRTRVQADRNRLLLRQTQEQQRLAAARLAQVLRLDPAVELIPDPNEIAPLALIQTNVALDALVQQTLAARPHLKQNAALVSASREARNGAAYGPLIPSVEAQGFWGGLGGGRRGIDDTFGAQQDYTVGLSWRIGPGGLFDFNRVRAADSRLKVAELNLNKVEDEAVRQVIEAFTRWHSLNDQLATARHALAAAEEGLQLAQRRKEFAVGAVLETIQTEQDLTQARLGYLRAVAELNKIQYLLNWATGSL